MRTLSRRYRWAAAWLLAMTLAGCGSEPDPASQVQSLEPPVAEAETPVATAEVATPPDPLVLPGDRTVLAKVNGEPITLFELDAAAEQMLGRAQLFLLGDEGRDKVLQSLVASRALAQRQLERMDPEDRAMLEKQVAAYREQLLVKAYLDETASPQPVSEAMVRDYYERHPEKFGGRRIREYEMLFATEVPRGTAKGRLELALEGVRESTEWQQAADALAGDGHPVRYRRGRVDPKLLKPEMRAVIESLEVGKASPVSMVQSRPYLARVSAEREVPARPLAEVSAEIRKMLLPVQLGKSIKALSGEVVAEADIVYVQDTEN